MKLAPSHLYQLRSSVTQILAQVPEFTQSAHLFSPIPKMQLDWRAAGGNNMFFVHIKLKLKEK